MQALFDAVNAICAKIQIVSNWFWDFPCNLDWYGSIPILGNFSLAIILLVGTGIYFTFRLHFVQVHNFIFAVKVLMQRNHTRNGISSLTAFLLSTAMRVGPGNILGVTGAISIGGPGALFWMWMAAFFGMATKYSECLLAVKYRTVDANGNISGGPMYYIENGLGKKYKPLAVMFAVFGVLCAYFGIGTFAQVNSIVEITQISAGIPVVYTGIALTVVVAAVTIGGLKSIATVAAKVVPAMALLYFLTTVGIMIVFADQVPAAIATVLNSAFTPTAAQGGFLGATVMLAMRSGVARGVFSNESGLGSAPIVAAAAKTKWAAEQGLISMTGTFIDTIIICTLTGLSLVVSGVWCGPLNGAAMTESAFTMAFPAFGSLLLLVGLVLFAFTTILGWNYYGERCVEYLMGVKAILPYRIIFICLIACGPFLKLEEIWVLADIVNGLMAIPNLIALIALSGVVVAETKAYQKHLDEQKNK